VRRDQRGKVCNHTAGWGTDHVGWGSCKLHGGSTRAGRAAALRQAGEAMMRADVGALQIGLSFLAQARWRDQG